MRKILGLALLFVGTSVYCVAGLTVAVPEIDSASGGAALALIAGALLVLRARRKS
ncbi:MAG TPA: hypothetical protein VKX49_18460 [Bryobacteraceae bacterium]|nr:hypothetical protein [Bryobacteraceae bacterium]